MSESLGPRAAAALADLLNRRTRVGLYGPITEGLSSHGVDAASYPVFSGIARYGPISAATLAPLVGLERTVASRYASRLEAAGLVDRTSDPADGRAFLLALTTHGEEIAAILRTRLAAELDARFADWPKPLAAAFVEGLERFVGRYADASGDS